MQKHKAHHGGRYDDPHGITRPQSSGRGRYLVHGESGGGTIWTSPSKGQEGRHDVTITKHGDKETRFHVKSAEFSHDMETGEARITGGTDVGSGQPFKGDYKLKTLGGNTHKD